MGKGPKRPDGIAMALMEVPIEKLSEHPDNPRKITAEKLADLKRSIQSIPAMLYKRPLVVVTHGDGYRVLGGNQRLRALRELGYEAVPVMLADELTEEQQREFIVKDNVAFGEWDWDVVEASWNADEIAEWGVDLPDGFGEPESPEQYTKKITPPIYEVTGEKPDVRSLFDMTTTASLHKEIEQADVPEEVKAFLRHAAHRHTVFNYRRIAEYYAHAPASVQRLMEASALVIIDFKQAIERGFVRLSQDIAKQYESDYGEEEGN